MVKPILPRGFKAKCQKMAVQFRSDLGLEPDEQLDAFILANYLGVKCIPHSDICAGREEFVCLNCSNWSAVLLVNEPNSLIIYNNTHSESRHQSSVMHEISHFILGHTAPPLLDDGLPLFHIDHEPTQELEANTLSSILLLPRIVLESCAKRSLTLDVIAKSYGISEALVRKEINMSGILKQYSRWEPFVN